MAQQEQKAVGRASVVSATLPDGVVLKQSMLGGHMVLYRGVLVGWVHADALECRAFARAKPPVAGEPLGTFERVDRAVARILRAAGQLSSVA